MGNELRRRCRRVVFSSLRSQIQRTLAGRFDAVSTLTIPQPDQPNQPMHKPKLRTAWAALLLAVAPVYAGTFNSDFSNPSQTGITLTSNSASRPDGSTFEPVIADGHLVLTWNENSEQGTIVLDDLDAGALIDGFTVSFKLQIGPGSGSPADGTSFAFGPEINEASNFGEEGTGTGVIVAFDIYDNGGGEAPAVEVKYGGNSIAIKKFAKADMVTGVFEDVQIQVTRGGTISVTYKGQKICENLMLPEYAPMAGRFAIGARTGGENANQWIDDLSITTTKSTSTAPVVTKQPQSQTVDEGSPVSFAIEFDGSAPMTFQWQENGVAIPGATNATYTIARAPFSANDTKYKCVIRNNINTATSSDAVLTVKPDTVPPVLKYATGSPIFTQVKVWFSEPMDPATAQTAANYKLSGGINVSAAALAVPAGTAGDNVVILTTTQQPEGTNLTLTVNNLKDVAGNPLATNSVKEFGSFVWVPGKVMNDYWQNVSAATIDALRNDPRFPDRPSFSTLEPMFEYPPDGGNEGGSNYGNKLSAWFTPSSSGTYIFFTCSDDPSNLYLSTDADPAHKKLIAQEIGYSSPRRWTSASSGDATSKRSDTFENSEWPPAPLSPINLQAGKKYYIEALHTEGGGGDNVGATFIKLGDADPEDGSAPKLAGSVIGTYMDPNAELKFVQQPTDQVGVLASTGITLLTQDFNANDGGFIVTNTEPAPPGPWSYDAAAGKWIADGSEDACTGPYNSTLNSPTYTLTQDGEVTVEFVHQYSFESDYYDGGQVRISVNGGAFTVVPADNFTANGYQPGNIVGTGILNGKRAFNADSTGYSSGEFITSKALLGTFSKNDKLVIQFLGAWDECTAGKHPNWVIDSFKLVMLPMIIQDFSKGAGGFTVTNTTPAPPGPWVYVATNGAWVANGSEDACTGPYNSRLNSPAYVVPQTDEVTLSFTHRYSFENDRWDGGQVRISVNGGEFTPVAAESFTANGYATTGPIQGTGILNGQPGFNANSTGYTNGEFITSSAVLGTFNQNDIIVVQFVGAWDECSSAIHPNWVIKNLQLAFGTAAKASKFEAKAEASLHGDPLQVNYQWQRNDGQGFANIVGATGTSLTIFPTAADFAATFRVQASVPGKQIDSTVVKLITGPVEAPEVSIAKVSGKVTIEFTGKLQSAAKPEGTYAEVPGATSPYTVPNTTGTQFYRSVK
jgi:hypothetical protein